MSTEDCIVFVTIPGFSMYEAGSDGGVWSNVRRRKIRLRPGFVKGYEQINIIRDCDRKIVKRFVHHMILEAFVGPRPDPPNDLGRHLNDIKTDNRPSNLAWGSLDDNAKDSIRNGRTRKGSRHHKAKLREEDIPDILEMRRRGMSQQKIADHFGVSQTNIGRILLGKGWSHVLRQR